MNRSMSPIRVHFLVCEMRPSVLWSYNQSITPLVHGDSTGILVVNLCANAMWGAWDRGSAMKHARVSAYIRSGAAAPDDLPDMGVLGGGLYVVCVPVVHIISLPNS